LRKVYERENDYPTKKQQIDNIKFILNF